MGRKQLNCTIDGCPAPFKAKGLCAAHYANLRRIGHPVPVRKWQRRSEVRREATESERAYIAGYFDGEGCLTVAIRPDGSNYVRVDFGQVVPHVVEFMESIYGGSLLEYPAKQKQQRPQTRWRLSRSSSVKKFLEDISPFCREKRDQVEGRMQRRKGRAFEQKIAREFRLRWPDAIVRRASQAERAYEPDVFIEGGPPLLSSLWLEMHDSRKPVAVKKLAQAERDVREVNGDFVPVVVWHKLGERSIQVTMRSWAFAWLAYNASYPDSQYVVTMDLISFMQLVEVAAKRRNAHA